jgi:putative endonuclease
MDAKALGRLGERRAAWFYRMRGYNVVGTNVRIRGGELDIVARRGRMLVFVEVKARQTTAAGEGFHAVDRRKQLQLARLAEAWLARHPHEGDVRFDVLSLFWTGLGFEVKHFPDAFRPRAHPRWPWRFA